SPSTSATFSNSSASDKSVLFSTIRFSASRSGKIPSSLKGSLIKILKAITTDTLLVFFNFIDKSELQFNESHLSKNPLHPLSYRRGEEVYHRGTTLFYCVSCTQSSLVSCLTHTTSSSTSFKPATTKGYSLISYAGSHQIPALLGNFFNKHIFVSVHFSYNIYYFILAKKDELSRFFHFYSFFMSKSRTVKGIKPQSSGFSFHQMTLAPNVFSK